ncbi:hypothetical protein [Haloparvum sp. PAK95]|uniref:hypothetical protein n=1 Tax=Haloparvum sp. PAK95 TaxID=3418962 RepID=UPI003D2F1387
MTATAVPLLFMIFGGSDDDLESIATILGTDPRTAAVERELESLATSIDETYAQVRDELSGSGEVPADAAPRRKAEAIERAVDRGQPRRDARTDMAAETPVRAATNVREEVRPSSPLAKRLLDQLSESRPATTEQLEETLTSTAEQLDERERSQQAMTELGPNADVDSVPELVDGYRSLERQRHTDEAEHDGLVDAVETLLDELDVDAEGSVEQRVRKATRTVGESSQECDTSDGSAVEDAVARVRHSAMPRSRRARKLLDALETGDAGEAAEELEAVVERLDRAATTDALLADFDAAEVDSLADAVRGELEDATAPPAVAVRERAADLSARVERVDDTNRVVPFAAREELKFYRRELVDQLGDGSAPEADDEAADLDAELERVRQRRAAIEREYVDQRADHNHSIPLYFLSLVDAELEDAADDADDGHTRRAAGTIESLDAVLDHVEGLYEQNQYSVMLRSLRG